MKAYFSSLNLLVFLFCVIAFIACEQTKEKRVLVFSKTAEYRHESISAGIAMMQKLGNENGFSVTTTENAEDFKEENLKQYAAVVFLNTTGDVLDHIQQADFERYIQAGGGFVGIHSAADTEYHWPWYGKLVGGYFNGHPDIQDAKMDVLDREHLSCNHLSETWERNDEWYNYKNLNSDVKVLLNLDESSYDGGTNGDNHPIAWYHDYDGGRAFYTGGGHTPESFEEPEFVQHILGGIEYAIGENTLDYSDVRFHRVPAENRFVKNVLARNLNEPMEMEIFDDGRIILIERRGAIKIYDPESEIMNQVTKVPVHTVHEDGLLGIALDPDYKENKWLYLFYSPVGDKPVQYVSRFVFDNDSLHYNTEKVVLEIPVQRDECCHSGGSIEFGPDGNLFIGVGDNTNPFDSDGYAPIDERNGRKPWDAQRSSGNTNDLRGKILRITPQPDGSYTIPEGNLFTEETEKTKSEIYVMGCRNPFRFSIDSKSKYLYWGDVGPDAGKDGMVRGPKGIDEINQARKAGNWGWPYFRGNNQRYHDFNFTTKESGALFNPDQPINDSPNNTGLQELPPSNKSIVWYSYDKSEEFPWVGVGGKNPMAGPIFYSEEYEGEEKFPKYFDGKLIAYEWMRHWMYLIKFDSTGSIIKVDPFMQHAEFSRPMDMLFGKDGKLYMIEYGNLWFARNMDARLVQIDYVRGNRSPVAKIKADKTVGGAPLTVIFSGNESYDFDEDKLKYEWDFGDGSPKNKTAFPRYTFKEAGIYSVKLTVTDPDGQKATASQEIQVGNDPPEVDWEIVGNQSFYWDNRNISYQVNANDKEDGSTKEGSINSENLVVSFDYLPQGYDITIAAQGHQTEGQAAAAPIGKQLINGSDCKSCHAKEVKVNGPSYMDIANRYRNDDFAGRDLARRVVNGSSGNWGSTAMAAHPQLTEEEAMEMVLYILSLGARKKVDSKYPASGQFVANEHLKEDQKGQYILLASYTDNGNESIKPITSRKQINLRYNVIQAEDFDDSSPSVEVNQSGVREIFHDDFLMYKKIDFTNIKSISMSFGIRSDRETGGTVELRIDAKDGQMIASTEVSKPGDASINLDGIQGFHDLYLIFKNPDNNGRQVAMLEWLKFHPVQTLSLK